MPVANDLPATATVLAVGAGCPFQLFANGNATLTAGEPYPSCSGAAQSPVWFKFTAPASGSIKVSTDGANGSLQNSKIAVFSATDSSDFGTFRILSCDEDNGENQNLGNMSIAFATGLTPGNTYYIAVDKSTAPVSDGSFCVTVDELDASMLSGNNDCSSDYQAPSVVASAQASDYRGWVSLVDESGNLVAAVRDLKGGNPDNFSASQYVHNGATRSDNAGTLYLNRNFSINYSGSNDSFDVCLFFTMQELQNLNGSATLNDLWVTKVTDNSCLEAFGDANPQSSTTLITPASVGQAGGMAWVTFFTTGFSNFFLANSNTPLPIIIGKIQAENRGAWNVITWNTQREEVGDIMELEHSMDGIAFLNIANIAAKGAASGYTYYDKKAMQGRNYYRLVLIDKGGVRRYSKIVSAYVPVAGNDFFVRAYPNPVANDVITILVNDDSYYNGTITIRDITGKTITTAVVQGEKTILHIGQLAHGIYFVGYKSPQASATIKLIKQ